jgi:phage I-like protein
MEKTRNAKAIAVAACVAEINSAVPTEIKLIPAGEFRATDGRPHGLKAWRLDADAAAKLAAQAEEAVGDYVIDYEHQTLNADKNGKEAPAAGWFKKLEWREGDGLYAVDVKWTAKARAMIEAGEYRYISPVFSFDKKTGVVLAVKMAALTNYPGIDGNSDLSAQAAAKFQTTTEEDTVDKAKLIALLGLPENASDAQIEQGMTALKAKADAADSKDTEIATLKADAGKADPAKYVPIESFEALKGEVAALKHEQTSGEVAALVSQGIKDGKLLPVQETWAKELGNKAIDTLKSYLDKTPAIAALKGTQTKGKAPKGDDAEALSAEELAVCKNLGIEPADYRKANPA